MPTLTRAKLAVVAPLVAILGLTTAATASSVAAEPRPAAAAESAVAGGEVFHRTELYFGRNKPDGEVTEEQFQHFVDVEVTKRFPDGLTLLDGTGQFQGSTGTVIKEKSKLLILLNPLSDRQANREIEDIRQAYKDQFQQESVLRVDDLEKVSF